MFTYKNKKKCYHRHAALKYYYFTADLQQYLFFYYQILQIQIIKKILIMKNKYFVGRIGFWIHAVTGTCTGI